MKRDDAEQLSLYEVEQMIDEDENLSSNDQTSLLIAYDQIMEFLEKGKKYYWSKWVGDVGGFDLER